MANPWGTESIAYAWGYGLYGQLGLGQNVRGSNYRIWFIESGNTLSRITLAIGVGGWLLMVIAAFF